MKNPKLKDRVVLLCSPKFKDSERNPYWGWTQGWVAGTIELIISPFICVKWDNSRVNFYIEDDLTLLSEAPANPNDTMSTTYSSVSQAVEETVNTEFLSKGLPFSAYDVTKKLRTLVNEGKAYISSLPSTVINGVMTQFVNHADVRHSVQMLMRSRTDYAGKALTDYVLYESVTTPAASAPTPATSRPSVVVGVAGNASLVPNDTKTKVVSYIQNRGPRTLKQIQSRLKVPGKQLTVRQIDDLVRSAGLRVSPANPYHASVVS